MVIVAMEAIVALAAAAGVRLGIRSDGGLDCIGIAGWVCRNIRTLSSELSYHAAVRFPQTYPFESPAGVIRSA